MPADAGVEDGRAGFFDGLRQLYHFVKGRAAFDQIEHGQAVDDDEMAADALAYATHDFNRETNAVCIRAAPFVGTLIGTRGDEFVDEVTFRTHDFHAVVAGCLRQCRAVDEIGDDLLDFFGGQFVRYEWVDRCFDGARRDQIRLVGVAAKVQNLHGDFAPFGVHGIGDDAVVLGFGFGGQHGAARHRTTAIIRRNPAGDDQTHASARALGVKRGHALKAVFDFFQPHVHGAHDDAVFQGGEAQIERAIEEWVVAHGRSFCGYLYDFLGVLHVYATGCKIIARFFI